MLATISDCYRTSMQHYGIAVLSNIIIYSSAYIHTCIIRNYHNTKQYSTNIFYVVYDL